MLPQLRLKVRVHGRHPWFFRKMIERPATPIPPGSAVSVIDRNGEFVGTGFYNRRTDLALRMIARDEVDDPDALLVARLDAAIDLRDEVLGLPATTDGYRLAHSEGDGLPGLILDRLGDAIVAQVFSLGLQQRLEPLGERLLERCPGARLVLTLDPTAKQREGLEPIPLPGDVETTVVERGIRYGVQAGKGHKTGFFADQRETRELVGRLAKGRRVLDLFCNSGGFALNARRGGAVRTLAADLDEAVVERAIANARDNRLQIEVEHADAFDVLRRIRPGEFDLVVLDPPKWASGRREVEAALARYRDLNRSALEKLAPGALLVTCSCSGALDEGGFLRTLRDAAAEARRDARVLAVRGAGPDHPVALECPETRYLKVVVLEVRGR